MSDKSFGVKQINLIGASGTPTIESPNNLNLNATTVAISTDVTIGGQVQSDLKINQLYSVGIGTTNPQAKLDVNGSLNVSGVSTISVNSSSDALRITQTGEGNALVVEDSTNPDSTPTVISATGRVGVGTTNPQYDVDVSGDINFTGSLYQNGTPVISGGGIGESYWASTDVGIHTLSNVGIGTTNPQYDVDVSGDINFTGSLYQNGTPVISGDSWVSTDVGIHTLSNVGIGSTIPQAKLDVSGDVYISGVVTATSFFGSGAGLTGLTGASQNTYGNGTAVPQIVIDSNGRITSVTNVAITGGASAGSGVNVDDNDSYVGFAGTINFGSGLSVSPLSATGVVTVTSFRDYWVSTAAGIHTLSSVGIGSTNPQAKLDVSPIGIDGISIGSTDLSMDVTGNGSLSSLDAGRFRQGGVPPFVSITNDTNTAGINFTPNTHQKEVAGLPAEYGTFSIFAQNPSNLYATDFISASSESGMNFGTGGGDGFQFHKVNSNGAVQPYLIAEISHISGFNLYEASNTFPRVLISGINTAGILSCSGAIFSSSSSDTAVRITQTGTGNALLVEDETNPDSTPVVISATGRVGIGTVNPQAKLDVRGDVKVGIDTTEGIILTSPNGTQYRLFVDNSGNLSTVSVT